jgi:nitroreductase
MDLLTAIEQRASAVRLTAPGPGPDELDRILRAAARAPDHGKLAPWRFVVVGQERRALFAEALAGVLRRKQPEASEAALNGERAKAMRAPLIVVVAARPVAGHKVPEIEQQMAVGAAVQNMLLAASALGYGAMWKTGAPAYDGGLKAELGLEPGDSIVAFVYLGTVAEPGQARAANLDGLVRHL